jgi:uncharacterized protein YukJ
VLDRVAHNDSRTPHYYIHLAGAGEQYRVAVNTRSGTSRHRRAHILYLADDDFRHPIVDRLADVGDGFHDVPSHPGGIALDYQRGGMFDRRHMRRIPANLPGPDNDLVDELDERVAFAIANPEVRLYAYGTRWGPEPDLTDFVFGFRPGNGIHDVHMNQGNRDEHWRDNSIWSDGGLLFREPDPGRWSAIFLAFQSQSWHTDEHGDPIPYPTSSNRRRIAGKDGQPRVRIVAAFVHPNEEETGAEHVAVLNDGDEPLLVAGWRLLNRAGDGVVLEGSVPPREIRRFPLPAEVQLSTLGGTIRLLNERGDEIDGVSYTRREARRKRGSLTF